MTVHWTTNKRNPELLFGFFLILCLFEKKNWASVLKKVGKKFNVQLLLCQYLPQICYNAFFKLWSSRFLFFSDFFLFLFNYYFEKRKTHNFCSGAIHIFFFASTLWMIFELFFVIVWNKKASFLSIMIFNNQWFFFICINFTVSNFQNGSKVKL